MSKTYPASLLVGLAFAALLVASICALVFGIVAHDESTFLTVCWKRDIAHYTTGVDRAGAKCERPAELRWSHMPLSVRVTSRDDATSTGEDRSGADSLSVMHEAIGIINSRLGFKALAHCDATTCADPDITVQWGETRVVGSGDRRGGYLYHTKDRGRVKAYAGIVEIVDLHLALRTAVHEFGHALGLAHDDYLGSIMYPSFDEAEDLTYIWISDADRKALRTRYSKY